MFKVQLNGVRKSSCGFFLSPDDISENGRIWFDLKENSFGKFVLYEGSIKKINYEQNNDANVKNNGHKKISSLEVYLKMKGGECMDSKRVYFWDEFCNLWYTPPNSAVYETSSNQ